MNGHAFLPDYASSAEAVIGLVGHPQVTGIHFVIQAAHHGLAFATLDSRLRRSLPEAEGAHVQPIAVRVQARQLPNSRGQR